MQPLDHDLLLRLEGKVDSLAASIVRMERHQLTLDERITVLIGHASAGVNAKAALTAHGIHHEKLDGQVAWIRGVLWLAMPLLLALASAALAMGIRP